jgi:hypothetical protein
LLSAIVFLGPYPTPVSGAGQPPKRVKRTCSALRADVEALSKSMKMKLSVTPGSWGDLPAPLRKLPAGAELCGVGQHGQAMIASAAFGKEIEDHYGPLFAEVGCKPLKCTVATATNCTCSGPGAAGGSVLTDTGAES